MFERMLIDRMENRVLVGVLCFVVMMIILGWAAINEGGRMVAFAESEHARSIENGADIFTSSCTICHGADGRGSAKAPGLNNPQLFGHDFFPDITKQVDDLTVEKSNLVKEQTDLSKKVADPATSDADKTSANARLAEIASRLPEIDAKLTDLNNQRITALKPAVDKGYDPAKPDRLKTLGYGGTRESFIITTALSGRPVSGSYFPLPMPTWSQLGGGPLRMDQLQDLAAYVLNWDKGDSWTQDDLFAVNQFAIEPKDPKPLEAQIELLKQSGGVLPEAIGTDVQAILAKLPGFTGDATNGEALFHGKVNSKLGFTLVCFTCHQQTADSVGPMANGLFSRVQNVRLKDPKLAGYTPEQYLVESITHPDAYIVPNFNDLMLKVFGTQLSYQDLADVVAYLETLK
jgi:mono/diheme cytochrome c family protein